ncbi:MAG: DNA adenine methylase [Chloroflexi bacterium]|nr:DNA adenine methylase [Chloroflexota bacterium]MQC16731.1 DNA adenine methylase [Chloroflexota bacterium]
MPGRRHASTQIPQATAVHRPPGAGRPFLKWAGGKSQILDPLIARSPHEFGAYHEPFVGGGAMFFGLLAGSTAAPDRVVLNDLNEDLVTTYRIVRDEVEALVEALHRLAGGYLMGGAEVRSAFYYEQRARIPDGDVDRAARFIFLNKTCFNGLYRVNRQGEFNVPHGRYSNPRILDEAGLQDASQALAGVELTCVDFAEALQIPQVGDFVYVDPPFEPLSKTSSFTGYTQGAFGREQQQRLKWCVDDLTDRGVHVMLSNSPHDYIRGLYSADRGQLSGQRYRIDSTPARRAINSRGDGRGAIDELIVMNYPSEAERQNREPIAQTHADRQSA